jgi:hypothetical protein
MTPPVVSIPERVSIVPGTKLKRRTKGKGTNIDEEESGSTLLAREDSTLNSGSVGDGLVRVDSLGRLLAVEVLLKKLLNLGDTGRTTDENNLADQRAVHADTEV